MELTRNRVEFVFCSSLMKDVYQRIDALRRDLTPILLRGEEGVGKKTIAQVIHQSSRPNGPFVTISLENLPEELQIRELFGCEGNSGCYPNWPGKLRFAQGGTLYIGEIAAMSEMVQAKLVRVLKEGQIASTTDGRPLKLDVRVVATTQPGSGATCETGTLHRGWVEELGIEVIAIPPLRERREDIPVLCEYFLRRLCETYGKTVGRIPEPLIRRFKNCDWATANLTELENAIKRYILFYVTSIRQETFH